MIKLIITPKFIIVDNNFDIDY